MADQDKEQALDSMWNKYISPAYVKEDDSKKPKYFVKDIANCDDKDVEIILLCESPHEEEVKDLDPENNTPLVGSSGQSVASFLFGENKIDPIGKLVKERNSKLPKMAVVNVCNVPLQVIDANKTDVGDLSLDRMRNNCLIISQLANNLKQRLLKYTNASTIIVCGVFAKEYYETIKSCLYKQLKPLFVPHPARNQWEFVFNHKDDLQKVKDLFNKEETET